MPPPHPPQQVPPPPLGTTVAVALTEELHHGQVMGGELREDSVSPQNKEEVTDGGEDEVLIRGPAHSPTLTVSTNRTAAWSRGCWETADQI